MSQNSITESNRKRGLVHPADVIRSKGWTYEEAAEQFFVDRSTIHRWLHKKSKPRARAFVDAAKLAN